MMGSSHAVSGTAAWLALTSSTSISLGVLPNVDAAGIAVGAAVATGAAMLPDLDHPSAKAARFLPPLTTGISRAVGTISGGHRHGTHSLVGIVAFTLLGWFATKWQISDVSWLDGANFQAGSALLSFLLIALGFKSLKLIPNDTVAWLGALAGAGAVGVLAPEQSWWLALAVGVGASAHILGDMLTVQGVPLLWPLKARPPVQTTFWRRNGYFALPILGSTSSWREGVLAGALAVYVVVVVVLMASTGA